MKNDKEISAGLLMYKKENNEYRVFLGHPGGIFWKNKNLWGIPKGHVEANENILEAAVREFSEETGITPGERNFIYLGSVKTSNKKTVHIYAFEGNEEFLGSNTCKIEYPKNSGNFIIIPEIDKAEFFSLDEAQKIMLPYQLPFLELFKQKIGR